MVHGYHLPGLVVCFALPTLLLAFPPGSYAGVTRRTRDVSLDEVEVDSHLLAFVIQLADDRHAFQLCQGSVPMLLVQLHDHGRHIHGQEHKLLLRLYLRLEWQRPQSPFHRATKNGFGAALPANGGVWEIVLHYIPSLAQVVDAQ